MNELATVPQTSIEKRLESLIDAFLCSQDVRENTKEVYRKQLKQFMGWMQERGIAEPTREDILAYRESLKARGLNASSIKGYMVAVRVFFTWAESIRCYPNVAKNIKGGKQARGFRKDPLTIEQARELLKSIDRSTLEGKRDFAFLSLLIGTGLRTIEVTRADVADISQQGGEAVLYVQGKGRDEKDELVVLTAQTLKPLREYLQARKAEEGEPLFTSLSHRNSNERLNTKTIRRVVKERLRGIGLDSKRLSAHSLRHTALTLALKGGATLQEAQRLARHSSINTTLIYTHDIDRIKQAPERKIAALLLATV
jgi:integrase/recombinase XerC/integrase/recombinase XerD